MKSKKLAQIAIAALEDMKGQSIRCINVEKLTSITDYMVIVTGTSSTHIRALADTVVIKLKAANQKITGVEGKMQSEWVLVDAGGVVIHIMMAPVRALYNLEDLWDFKGQNASDNEADIAEMHSVVSEKKNFKKAIAAKKVTRKKTPQAGTNSTARKSSASKRTPASPAKPVAKKSARSKTARVRSRGKVTE